MTKAELEARGVNFDNMTYPNGELNIIVQSFACDKESLEEGQELEVYPDIYQPRRNYLWSMGDDGYAIDLENEDSRKDYIAHLRDSAERLKIMSIYLSKQADELEEFGESYTHCYYAEEHK